MDVILQTYYILLPIVATALIGWLGKILSDDRKDRKKRQQELENREKEIDQIRKANSEGIKLVLRYMLKRYHTEYMIQGEITYDQYKDWCDIYSAYEALHGNSVAGKWDNDINMLPQVSSIDSMTPFEAILKESMEKRVTDKKTSKEHKV